MALPVSGLPATCIRFSIPYPLPTVPEPVSVILDVPIAKLEQLVFRPVRWMKLLAWGILGCEGDVVHCHKTPLPIDLHIGDIQPGEYSFVHARDAQVHLLNLEHTRTTARSISSRTSAAYHCPDPAPAGRDALLADRDGELCVFSGTLRPQHAHIIPQSFSHMTERLRALSAARCFGIDHHLDPRNTITVLHDLHVEWDRRRGFILATDDRFLRDEDIPPPSGPSRAPRDSDGTRPEKTAAYVWQMLREHQDPASVVCLLVRPNERARFNNPSSPALPSAAAVNYVYAAGMVREFLCPGETHAELLALLARPERSAAPPPPRAAGDDDDAPRMDAVEFLFRLTHQGRFLSDHDSDGARRAAELANARRLDEWRHSVTVPDAATEPPNRDQTDPLGL